MIDCLVCLLCILGSRCSGGINLDESWVNDRLLVLFPSVPRTRQHNGPWDTHRPSWDPFRADRETEWFDTTVMESCESACMHGGRASLFLSLALSTNRVQNSLWNALFQPRSSEWRCLTFTNCWSSVSRGQAKYCMSCFVASILYEACELVQHCSLGYDTIYFFCNLVLNISFFHFKWLLQRVADLAEAC